MVVRIGTWNLENLFKPPSEYGPKTDAEYDAKLAALASAITRMDPHVRAVQEVGDPAALQALADRVGGTWHIETADPEAGTNHTIRVGMLSRVVLTQPKQISAFPDKLRAIQQGRRTRRRHRGLGQTRSPCSCPPRRRRHRNHHRALQIQAADVPRRPTLARTMKPERGWFSAYALYRRSAEATTACAAATDLLTGQPQRAAVVLGDLNDEVEAATTQIVSGPPGSEIGTTGVDRPDNGDAQRLWNLAPRINTEPSDSAESTAGPTPSIDDDPTQRRGAAGSDHRPVLHQSTSEVLKPLISVT